MNDRSPSWTRSGPTLLGLLAVALLGCATWLLLPRPTTDGAHLGPPVRVVLVDASASARRSHSHWVREVRAALAQEGAAAAAAGEELAVIVFARDVRLRFGPADPAGLLDALVGREGREPFDPAEGAGRDDESRLGGALDLARGLALAPERRPGSLVLLGEGSYTGADPMPVLATLARRGVPLRRRAPGPPDRPDLAVLDLVLPATVEANAPLFAVAHVSYRAGTVAPEEALLAVLVSAEGVDRPQLVPLELPELAPGAEARWEVGIDCGPAAFGRTRVRVDALVSPRVDAVPENDGRHASCVAEGELVVGVVVREVLRAAAHDWLTPSGSSALPGLQFHFLDPDELVGTLDDLDALVTYDVPTARLPARQLEAWVRGGGGWLTTAGWRFMADQAPGAGGRLTSDLQRLLPLEAAPADQGPRDVVLLVDGSGSMDGAPFDAVRAAAVELVGSAFPGDRVSLRFFTTHLEDETLVKERVGPGAPADVDAASEEAARRLLAARVPGDQTYILRSLDQFASDREAAGVETLAFLLTDGREREYVQERAARQAGLRARLRAARTQLVVIAVGDDPALGFLAGLTRPGEDVARAERLDELEAIFRREVSGTRTREGEALAVRVRAAAAGTLAAEVLGSAGSERVGETMPPLQRYVLNRARPGASVLWDSEAEHPLLAVQRVGLGRTASFASLPGDEWARSWTRRQGVGEPARFGVVLRWLGRGTARHRRMRPRLEVAPDRGGELWLRGLDASWPARFRAELVDPSRAARREPPLVPLAFELAPSNAGVDPRASRVARLAPEVWDRRGREGLLLALPDPEGPAGATGGERVLAVELGPAPEHVRGERRLPAAAFAPEGPGRGPRAGFEAPLGAAHPAGPGVLLAACVALFGAAAWGRVGRG